jgi:hypothetical protein
MKIFDQLLKFFFKKKLKDKYFKLTFFKAWVFNCKIDEKLVFPFI